VNSTRLTLLGVLLLPLLPLLGGCADPEIVEIPTLEINTDHCPMDEPPTGETINMAVVELYQNTSNDDSELQNCVQCLGFEEDNCVIAASQCRCGPDHATDSLHLFEMIQNSTLPTLTFENIDPDFRYCIRIMALQVEESYDTLQECTCPPVSVGENNAQVCTLSNVVPGSGGTDLKVEDPLCSGNSGDSFMRCTAADTPP
jgi:hypothetical protein